MIERFFIQLPARLLCICFCWQPILWWRCTFWSSQRLSDIMFLPVWYWSYRKGYSIRKGKCICLTIFFPDGIHPSRLLWINKLLACLFVSYSIIMCFVGLLNSILVQSGTIQYWLTVFWVEGKQNHLHSHILIWT